MAKRRKRKPLAAPLEEAPAGKHILREIIFWILELAAAILLGFLLVRFGIEKMEVNGSSMDTVLENEDSVVIEKITGKISGYKRFDVIAFKQSGTEHNYYNIKRIIGLPGETVQIAGGAVYINGELLTDEYAVEEMANAGVASKEIELEEDEYFVLGDNRNNSEDSRFANVGNVVKSDIIGKVWIRLSPGFGIVSLLKPEKEDTE
jgi:signal peptidase I